MNIKVFGPGCARCTETEKIVSIAVQNVGIHATVEKVTDMQEMVSLGIMSTPAIVVDNQVICSGRVPKLTEIENYLKTVLVSKGCSCGCH